MFGQLFEGPVIPAFPADTRVDARHGLWPYLFIAFGADILVDILAQIDFIVVSGNRSNLDSFIKIILIN